MPEAMRKLCPDETEAYIVVQFLSNLEEESNYILETAFVKVNGNASLLAFTADTPLDEVYLRVSYNVNPVLPSDADWSALSGYSFGTLWSGVSFYGAEGFAFEDPSGKKSDAFNCFLDYSFDAPAFKTTWQDVFHEYGNDGPREGYDPHVYRRGQQSADGGNHRLSERMQGCPGGKRYPG